MHCRDREKEAWMDDTEEHRRRAWDENNLEQLLYFGSLTLREKLRAVEGMCDVVRRLSEMRARGELSEPRNLAGHA
jgi:hypothetical protein